jgi:hypothetical protein
MADIRYEVPRIPLFVGLANAPANSERVYDMLWEAVRRLEQDPRGWFQWCCRYYMPADASSDKSKGGAPRNIMLRNSERIVPGGRSIAGPGRDRPCLIGRMIRQRI